MQIIDLNPMLGLCKECYDYSGVQIKNHDFITKQTIDYFVCQWGQWIKKPTHNPNENREVLVYEYIWRLNFHTAKFDNLKDMKM